MNSNIETEDDIKEYLAFLKEVAEEVANWPERKKVPGYASRDGRDDREAVRLR